MWFEARKADRADAKEMPLYAGPNTLVNFIFFSFISSIKRLLIIERDSPSEKTPLLKKYGLIRSDLSLKLPN